MSSLIEDYALIGDCETAALVSRSGSVDWLCFPRFDSGACFAALLGTPEHGRWLLTPGGDIRHIRRRYWQGSLILETEYETDTGVVTLTDWMPPRTAAPDVVRLVEGKQGQVPMRIGNAAWHQHQLDVYGEVMDALHLARRGGLEPNANAWRVQRALMDFLETDWDKPDEGIWEVRGPRRHFTHSKVMAWVAVDRAIKAVEAFGLDGPVEQWRQLRSTIYRQVCSQGFDPELNAFVQSYDSKELDASLLMLPLVGFLPATDPRMRGTVEAIQQRLMKDGFVHRYATVSDVDGLPPGEGAFLLCTFWLADNLALQGRYAEARDIFEHLLDLRNDVGLLSEEYDPHTRRLLGNFPQAFSHVGLINTARNLARAEEGPAEHRQRS